MTFVAGDEFRAEFEVGDKVKIVLLPETLGLNWTPWIHVGMIGTVIEAHPSITDLYVVKFDKKVFRRGWFRKPTFPDDIEIWYNSRHLRKVP